MDQLKLQLIQQIIHCQDESLLRAVARLLAAPSPPETPELDKAVKGVLSRPNDSSELESLRREIDELFGE